MSTAETGFPLRQGADAAFATVRAFFARAGFSDAELCRVLGMEKMSDLGRVKWDEAPLATLPAPLRWCLAVMVRGQPAPATETAALCGEPTLAAFRELQLLRPAKKDPTHLVCPAWVYPGDGFVLASDRTDDPDGEPFTPAADVVFPGIYGGTLRFLDLLPDASGGDALDVCGGSGVGALHLARTARTAVTADITARSAFFAEFNARLNGAAVESLCGDLYAPAAGRHFDVITAHPPFVPATGETMVYSDAGVTGEVIIRRTIEGLPDHLRSGGTALVLCVARDTEEGTFEQRARSWLGATAGEFDVVFGLERILTVERVVESLRQRGNHLSDEQARQLHERLRSSGTRQFVYGALFVRRSPGAVPEPPLRLQLTPDGRATDFDRVFAWRRHCRRPDLFTWMSAARPRLAPAVRLEARHVVQDGELVPAEFVFSVEGGFQYALRPDPWIVPLVAKFNGSRAVSDVFAAARAAQEFPLAVFAQLLQSLVTHGLLEVEFPREG